MNKFLSLLTLVLAFAASGVYAQSSGGVYAVTQSVIANGGGTSSDAVNNNYKVEGTGGQFAAGTLTSSGSYSARAGFWSPLPLAPTAAGASVGGRVVGLGGEGLRNVTVILAGGSLFTPRSTRTNSLGNFAFNDVEVGQVYTVSVQNKKYGFAQESYIVSLVDSVADIVFRATWEN